MKRHQTLIEISREHHTVLSFSKRILDHPQDHHLPEILAKRTMLLAHFDEEEQQFAGYWEKLPDPALSQKFAEEHRHLRHLLAAADQSSSWEALALALRDHVRFEERELFPALEQYALTTKEEI